MYRSSFFLTMSVIYQGQRVSGLTERERKHNEDFLRALRNGEPLPDVPPRDDLWVGEFYVQLYHTPDSAGGYWVPIDKFDDKQSAQDFLAKCQKARPEREHRVVDYETEKASSFMRDGKSVI